MKKLEEAREFEKLLSGVMEGGGDVWLPVERVGLPTGAKYEKGNNVVSPSTVYISEEWVLNATGNTRVEVFDMKCLKR